MISISDFEKGSNSILRILHAGENIYIRLLDIRPKDTDMIICPEHLGDTIWIVVLAKAYIKEHDCKNLYFVVKESQMEMVNHFPDVAGTVGLSNDEMYALRLYIVSLELWNENHIVFGSAHDMLAFKGGMFFLMTGFGNKESREKRMKQNRMYWLGIQEEAPLSQMLPLDDGNDQELISLFGHAVLLIPTAQSEESIPLDFWTDLACRLKEKGYDVYTNYNGFEYEQMIDGTTPLSSTIIELALISPYFVSVISLRSGASDLVAETNAKLTILYNENIPNKGIRLEPGDVSWDSIHELVDRENIFYYQYIPDKSDDLISALTHSI